MKRLSLLTLALAVWLALPTPVVAATLVPTKTPTKVPTRTPTPAPTADLAKATNALNAVLDERSAALSYYTSANNEAKELRLELKEKMASGKNYYLATLQNLADRIKAAESKASSYLTQYNAGTEKMNYLRLTIKAAQAGKPAPTITPTPRPQTVEEAKVASVVAYYQAILAKNNPERALQDPNFVHNPDAVVKAKASLTQVVAEYQRLRKETEAYLKIEQAVNASTKAKQALENKKALAESAVDQARRYLLTKLLGSPQDAEATQKAQAKATETARLYTAAVAALSKATVYPTPKSTPAAKIYPRPTATPEGVRYKMEAARAATFGAMDAAKTLVADKTKQASLNASATAVAKVRQYELTVLSKLQTLSPDQREQLGVNDRIKQAETQLKKAETAGNAAEINSAKTVVAQRNLDKISLNARLAFQAENAWKTPKATATPNRTQTAVQVNAYGTALAIINATQTQRAVVIFAERTAGALTATAVFLKQAQDNPELLYKARIMVDLFKQGLITEAKLKDNLKRIGLEHFMPTATPPPTATPRATTTPVPSSTPLRPLPTRIPLSTQAGSAIQQVKTDQARQGAQDLQNARNDLYTGLTYVDTYGFRVQLAQVVLRPDAATLQRSHFTKRSTGPNAGESSFTHRVTFNQALPSDWSGVLKRSLNDPDNISGGLPIYYRLSEQVSMASPSACSLCITQLYQVPQQHSGVWKQGYSERFAVMGQDLGKQAFNSLGTLLAGSDNITVQVARNDAGKVWQMQYFNNTQGRVMFWVDLKMGNGFGSYLSPLQYQATQPTSLRSFNSVVPNAFYELQLYSPLFNGRSIHLMLPSTVIPEAF